LIRSRRRGARQPVPAIGRNSTFRRKVESRSAEARKDRGSDRGSLRPHAPQRRIRVRIPEPQSAGLPLSRTTAGLGQCIDLERLLSLPRPAPPGLPRSRAGTQGRAAPHSGRSAKASRVSLSSRCQRP
jgi:hypothetical protein